jgi:hypothetical protein
MKIGKKVKKADAFKCKAQADAYAKRGIRKRIY